MQLIWLIVLLPALVVGAKLAGIAGVGMAEVAVAALLVLPWYLYELSRVGIPLPAPRPQYVVPGGRRARRRPVRSRRQPVGRGQPRSAGRRSGW